MSPILDLDPCPGLSSMSMLQKVLAQLLATDIGSSDPYRGKKEQIVSVGVPLITRTVVSQHSGIPTSRGNPVSSVQADDNDSTLSALSSK